MNRLYTVIFLALSLTLSAACQKTESSPKPVAKAPTLEEAQNQGRGPIDLSKLSTREKSKLSCVQSLCGNSYPFDFEYEKHPELLTTNNAVIEKNLGRQIKLYMGQVIKNELAMNALMAQVRKADTAKIEFSNDQIGFVNMLQYIPKLGLYSAAFEFDVTKMKFSFNAEKLRKLDPKLSDLEIEAIQTLAVIFLNIPVQADAMTAPTILDIVKQKAGIPALTTSVETLKLLAQEIPKLKKQVVSLMLMDLHKVENEHIILKAQNGESLNEKELADFINAYQNFFMMSQLTTDEILGSFAKLPFSKNSLQQNLINNYDKNIGRIFNDKTTLKPTFADGVTKCELSLTQSYSNTPTAVENAKAQNALKHIVEKANALAKTMAPDTPLNPLEVEFFLPKDQDQSLKEWGDTLSQSLQSIKAVSAFVEKSQLKSSEVTAALIIALSTKYQTAPELFSDVIKACEQTQPAFLSDAALPSGNRFRASWVTVKNLDYGVGIMAHEIGHIVSKKWSTLFVSDKACLTSKYNNEKYLEEDFADLFSSKILLEMKKSAMISATPNMICGFPTFKGPMLDFLTVSPLNESDVHSPDLYRLLAVGQSLGNSTPECSDYLRDYENKAWVFKPYCEMR